MTNPASPPAPIKAFWTAQNYLYLVQNSKIRLPLVKNRVDVGQGFSLASPLECTWVRATLKGCPTELKFLYIKIGLQRLL